MNLWVPYNAGTFLTIKGSISFSRTLFDSVVFPHLTCVLYMTIFRNTTPFCNEALVKGSNFLSYGGMNYVLPCSGSCSFMKYTNGSVPRRECIFFNVSAVLNKFTRRMQVGLHVKLMELWTFPDLQFLWKWWCVSNRLCSKAHISFLHLPNVSKTQRNLKGLFLSNLTVTSSEYSSYTFIEVCGSGWAWKVKHFDQFLHAFVDIC
jgi:hypothetical protein